MSQQPPSGNFQWFKPKPGQTFPENVQYLGAWRRPEFGDWRYHCGIIEPDGFGAWSLHSGYAEMDLDDFDWLARLDDGKPDPQQTLFAESELTGRIEIDDPRVNWPATVEELQKLFTELAELRRRAEGGE